MALTASTVRTLTRELHLEHGEDADAAMRRVDRAEVDAVRRHLLGDLLCEQARDRTRPSR